MLSIVLLKFLNDFGTAKAAAKSELSSLIAILWMAYTERTFLRVVTSTHWSSLNSSVWLIVAWFAVVSCSEAEEQCNVAAVLAFVVNILCSVDIAALHSCTDHLCRALSTD